MVTAKTIKPWLLSTLNKLSDGTPDIPIPVKDISQDLCEVLGLETISRQQVYQAFRKLKAEGLSTLAYRGHWAITKKGVESTCELPSLQTTPYDKDFYIRSLAIAATSCFGAFSPTDKTCCGCALSSYCKNAVSIKKVEIAAQIHASLEQEQRKIQEKIKKKASVDELINTLEKSNAPYNPLPSQPVDRIVSQVHTICHQCHKGIPQNTDAYWISGQGIFHLHCVNVSQENE